MDSPLLECDIITILSLQKPAVTSQSPTLASTCDILRDCRKSPKMANLAISHVMKSMTYKHQIH